jgi:intraflagellar transport protein 140
MMMPSNYSCIRSLKSEAVWTNLARMCVQTGRLDVAKVCLGHLQLARSVRALRRAMEDGSLEHEAKVAILAIELNMIDEAIELYKKCERYDLLNRLYQASGRFEEALKIAEEFDRVHLKNTYFKYAEWLRELGDTKEALKYYEMASNSTHNITEMLMENASDLKVRDIEIRRPFHQFFQNPF